jgi:hypothetical protein
MTATLRAHVSIETGGHFDLDAELKVWVRKLDAIPANVQQAAQRL